MLIPYQMSVVGKYVYLLMIKQIWTQEKYAEVVHEIVLSEFNV